MKSEKRIHLALDEWNSWYVLLMVAACHAPQVHAFRHPWRRWGRPTPKRGLAEASEEWSVGRPLLQEEVGFL